MWYLLTRLKKFQQSERKQLQSITKRSKYIETYLLLFIYAWTSFFLVLNDDIPLREKLKQ